MIYIVEFEGFALATQFIFKEVSLINVDTEECTNLFLRSPFPRKCLSAKDKQNVNFCESHLHKIKWFSGIHKFREFKNLLSKIGINDRVYTKGVQKVEILQKVLNSNIAVIIWKILVARTFHHTFRNLI